MGKYGLDRANLLIFASETNRIRVLGACYRNRVLKIRNRPLADDEIKFIAGLKDDEEFKNTVGTLKKLGLVNPEERPIPGMSWHTCVDITDKGIEVLNELGITEEKIRDMDRQ